jgi:hypothetical protein
MAVSKRTRFEVLRRDDNNCRYCHATDSPLTIDHVVPVALGGSDDPCNLVAACKDCNAGKSSASPDAPLVAQVSDFNLRWREAMDLAIQGAETENGERNYIRQQLLEYFEFEWLHRYDPPLPALPYDWEQSIVTFYAAGLHVALLDEAIDITAARRGLTGDRVFRYFAGVCWNKIREIQDTAQRIFQAREAGDTDGA